MLRNVGAHRLSDVTQTGERIRFAFAQLTRDRSDLSDLDPSVMAAFERLTQGHPNLTDGTVNVTNLCAEAGISRASYYRSPAPRSSRNCSKRRPPRRRSSTGYPMKSDSSDAPSATCGADTPPPSASSRTPSRPTRNRIQILTPANAELRDENNRLQRQAEQHTNVRRLHTSRPKPHALIGAPTGAAPRSVRPAS